MKAYEVYEVEGKGHCKGWFAKDVEGNEVPPSSDNVASVCVYGAVFRAYPATSPEIKAAMDKLRDETHGNPALWNDDPERTREEVVKLLKQLDI